MKRRVVLVGQPNVGKSSIVAALTGARVRVSNYPGTTVEVSTATAVIGGVEYEFIDTPGVYNLYPSSIEEEVTERVLLEWDYDAVVLVVDATAVERGLLLAVAVAELAPPMVVAVNFWEEAERRGIRIDYEALERLLGVPVVRVNPLRRDGLRELVERLGEARRPRLRVAYDDHIEEAIRESMECIPVDVRLSRRGLAARLVEGDPVVCGRYCCPRAREARERLRRMGHDPYRDVEAARAGVALELAAAAVRMAATSEPGLGPLDRLALRRPLLGAALAAASVAAVFAAVVAAGGRLAGLLDQALSPLLTALLEGIEGGGFAGYAVSTVLQALYAQYVAAVPYVFIFYLLLVALEDSGALARMMLWLYPLTRRLGLHPKAVIPVLLGMGCSVPAVRATRVLPSLGQRLAAVAALAFVPCSSRASIVFAVAGRRLGAWAPALVYGLGFALGLAAAAVVVRLTRSRDDAVLVEDLPPLRSPRLGSVAAKAWEKLRDFLAVVTPFIVAGALAYAAVDWLGAAPLLAAPLQPVARLLGLPAEAAIPLAYGFLQKDLTVAMLAAVLGTPDPASALTGRQALAFTLAASYQVPCIIAFGAMVREFGARRALAMLLALDMAGLAVAATVPRLLPLEG